MSLRPALEAFWTPVPLESRRLLERAFEAIPETWRADPQHLGRQYAGCGATLGAMPRCDFACRGCYLGKSANRTPALPLSAVKEQILTLRSWLGPGGNLQLTDGELTLLEDGDLLELVRFARSQQLVPMLMTHGDALLREPRRLDALVRGGLTELSIHVDSTQRGRRDPRFRFANSELALMELRDEFAELIRGLRRRTGRKLDVATTVTVTRENLHEVSDVVAWCVANADAFKMVSFQPIAAVGRTEAGLTAAVSRQELWARIELGLGLAPGTAEAHQGWFGHPSCSRFLQGAVLAAGGAAPKRFAPLLDPADAKDRRLHRRLLARLGGLTFRLDRRTTAAARIAGLLLRWPGMLGISVPAWAWRWLGRVSRAPRIPQLFSLLRRDSRVHYLNVVSHHFMNGEELQTDEGRERVALCAFKVAIDGETVSMCEANAGGRRDAFYRDIHIGDGR